MTITAEEWDRMCYQMGITRRVEIHRMSLQEFVLRRQAFMRQERNAIRRQLMVVNTILGVVGEEAVSLDDLVEAGRGRTDQERKDYEALKGRYPEFATDQTL